MGVWVGEFVGSIEKLGRENVKLWKSKSFNEALESSKNFSKSRESFRCDETPVPPFSMCKQPKSPLRDVSHRTKVFSSCWSIFCLEKFSVNKQSPCSARAGNFHIVQRLQPESSIINNLYDDCLSGENERTSDVKLVLRSPFSATENPRIALLWNHEQLVLFFFNTFYRYLISDALVYVIAVINSHEFHIFLSTNCMKLGEMPANAISTRRKNWGDCFLRKSELEKLSGWKQNEKC